MVCAAIALCIWGDWVGDHLSVYLRARSTCKAGLPGRSTCTAGLPGRSTCRAGVAGRRPPARLLDDDIRHRGGLRHHRGRLHHAVGGLRQIVTTAPPAPPSDCRPAFNIPVSVMRATVTAPSVDAVRPRPLYISPV